MCTRLVTAAAQYLHCTLLLEHFQHAAVTWLQGLTERPQLVTCRLTASRALCPSSASAQTALPLQRNGALLVSSLAKKGEWLVVDSMSD